MKQLLDLTGDTDDRHVRQDSFGPWWKVSIFILHKNNNKQINKKVGSFLNPSRRIQLSLE